MKSRIGLHDAGGVTNLIVAQDDPRVDKPPVAVLAADPTIRAGKPALFDGRCCEDPGGRRLNYRWDLGDGTVQTREKFEHVFKEPGYYRVGLTADNGALAALAWLDAYVVDDVDEIGTEGGAARWSFVCQTNTSRIAFEDDGKTRVCGKSSLFANITPYGGFRVAPFFPASRDAGLSLKGKERLVFWSRWLNGDVTGWQDGNPVVTLHESDASFIRLVPSEDWFRAPQHNEGRDGWNYFSIPLAGDARFKREGAETLNAVNWISIGVDSWGAPPLRIWVDGLGLK
jgi:hypothetical protein